MFNPGIRNILRRQRMLIVLLLFFAGSNRSFSQSFSDSITITLSELENTFLTKNFSLLASKYEIDAGKALEVQARVFDNPNFYFEQSIYNPQSKRYFPAKTVYGDGSLGQNQMNVQQLFSIAGKRNKRLHLAKINTQIAQYQFYDLIRTLHFQLRTNFYDLYFALKTYAVYADQVSAIEKNINAYKDQVDKGNISLSEYLRLSAFLNTLKGEKRESAFAINEANNNLHVLLADSSLKFYKPVLQIKNNLFDENDLNLKQLLDSSIANRSDVKIQEFLTRQEQANLTYQKSLGMPDLNIAGTYDRNGSYIQNYYGVAIGFQIPLFNRNQGNIKASRARLKSNELNHQLYKLSVQQDVIAAYKILIETNKVYLSTDKTLQTKFNDLLKGLTENYTKRNISIVEFIDYYESFKNNIIQLNHLENELYNATENLNYEVGKTIIK
ncbi:MAG: TolC family protein [Bacteroidetes bacterium]|nr:TolC family protein [Bacteroidota bacterium]